MERAETSAADSAGRLAAGEASAEPESVTEPRSTSVALAGVAEADARARADGDAEAVGGVERATQEPLVSVKPEAQPQIASEVDEQAEATV